MLKGGRDRVNSVDDGRVGVSIIIPCLNEENHIAACLTSILRNDYPASRLEVLVVDGGSKDATRRIVRRYEGSFASLRIVDNPDRIKPIALNKGIRAASSDIIMRMDAHTSYPAHYISRLVGLLRELDVNNVGGVVVPDSGHGLVEHAIGSAMLHPFAAGNSPRTGNGQHELRRAESVAFGCYRRDIFERIGLFNERLIRAQDREFNARLRAAGGEIVLDPGVRCTYYPRRTIGAYTRWTVKGAYWLFYSWRFTDTPMLSWRNLVPVGFVLWHVLVLLTLALSPALALAASLPVLMYFVINIAVSIHAAAKRRRLGMALVLPLLFAITHYGYGLGALAGFLHARIGQRELWKIEKLRRSPTTADA